MEKRACTYMFVIYKDIFYLFSRKAGPAVCGRSHDTESPYYKPLNPCIAGTRSERWIPIEYRTPWPARVRLNSTELNIHGNIHHKIICFSHFLPVYAIINSTLSGMEGCPVSYADVFELKYKHMYCRKNYYYHICACRI